MWQSQPDRAATAPAKLASEVVEEQGGEQPTAEAEAADDASVNVSASGTARRTQGQGGGARAAAHAATDSAEGRLRVLWTGAVLLFILRSQSESLQAR